jgi:hypothetical protein
MQAQLDRARAAANAPTLESVSHRSSEPSRNFHSRQHGHATAPELDGCSSGSAAACSMESHSGHATGPAAPGNPPHPTTASVASLERLQRLERMATGAHIVAPCSHDGPCPMDTAPSAAGWCHFRQRFERTHLHRMCVWQPSALKR